MHGQPIPDLDRALELVSAAFRDAMHEYGLLPGTCRVIAAMAEQTVDAAIEAAIRDDVSESQ